ncbi:MAG: hypothetical protein GEV10_26270 [Streptosporangiales bacterium]|nr:hypothetical protein [Streptosporangiales bacterium]
MTASVGATPARATDPYPPPGAAVPGAPPPLLRSRGAPVPVPDPPRDAPDESRRGGGVPRIDPSLVVLGAVAVASAIAAARWYRNRRSGH